MKYWLSGLVFSFAVVATLVADAADLVVIASNTPGLEAGKVISAESRINIPAGASVTVVAESGQALTLSGPFSGVPNIGAAATADSSLVSSLSALLETRGSAATSLGTMRSGPKWGPDDLWTVPADISGTRCVVAGRPVTLWRHDGPDAPARFAVTDAANGRKVEFSWPADRTQAAWPAGLPLADGHAYFLHREGEPSARRIVVRLVPGGLPTDAHRVVWMAENGCRQQARHLLSTLR